MRDLLNTRKAKKNISVVLDKICSLFFCLKSRCPIFFSLFFHVRFFSGLWVARPFGFTPRRKITHPRIEDAPPLWPRTHTKLMQREHSTAKQFFTSHAISLVFLIKKKRKNVNSNFFKFIICSFFYLNSENNKLLGN